MADVLRPSREGWSLVREVPPRGGTIGRLEAVGLPCPCLYDLRTLDTWKTLRDLGSVHELIGVDFASHGPQRSRLRRSRIAARKRGSRGLAPHFESSSRVRVFTDTALYRADLWPYPTSRSSSSRRDQTLLVNGYRYRDEDNLIADNGIHADRPRWIRIIRSQAHFDSASTSRLGGGE